MFKKTGYVIREENGCLPIGHHPSYPQIYDRYDGAIRAVGKKNAHKIFMVELVEMQDDRTWWILNTELGTKGEETFSSRVEAEKPRDKLTNGWNWKYEIVFE